MPAQFMIDIESTELSDMERMILKNPNIGSVILFTRNFNDLVQLKELITEINTVNPDLFIAVDHEGGNVQRFQRQGFSSLPSARSYGKVYDKNKAVGIEYAQEYGTIMAQELLACGIDLSLAPILDLHDTSTVIAGLDRAFHENPNAVVDLAGAFIQGMNAAGMPAIGKHFPGHGSVVSDSHCTMPISVAPMDELLSKDLKPFIDLIKKGLLAGVMPAYVTYEAVDKENSAGFSKIWLEDILRDQLGFAGLVLSDCISMKGADIGNLMTRAEKALKAGCDIVIVSHQPRTLLLELLHTIQVEQSPESAARIASFKSLMPGLSKKNKIMPCASHNAAKTKESVAVSQYEKFNTTLSV